MDPLILLPIAFFTTLMALITWFGYVRYARTGEAYSTLGRSISTASTTYDKEGHETVFVRIIRKVGQKVPLSVLSHAR